MSTESERSPPGHAWAAGEAGAAVPIAWFDDLALGMRFRSAETLVTAEDIKRFAAEFDPQAYHLDEEAAKGTALR